MTLPDERYRAIVRAEYFLRGLCDPSITRGVSRAVREQARSILRHYPTTYDLDRLSEKSPDVIIREMEPLTRMVMSYNEEKRDDHAS